MADGDEVLEGSEPPVPRDSPWPATGATLMIAGAVSFLTGGGASTVGAAVCALFVFTGGYIVFAPWTHWPLPHPSRRTRKRWRIFVSVGLVVAVAVLYAATRPKPTLAFHITQVNIARTEAIDQLGKPIVDKKGRAVRRLTVTVGFVNDGDEANIAFAELGRLASVSQASAAITWVKAETLRGISSAAWREAPPRVPKEATFDSEPYSQEQLDALDARQLAYYFAVEIRLRNGRAYKDFAYCGINKDRRGEAYDC